MIIKVDCCSSAKTAMNHNAFVLTVHENREGNLGLQEVSKYDSWEGGPVSISLGHSFLTLAKG